MVEIFQKVPRPALKFVTFVARDSLQNWFRQVVEPPVPIPRVLVVRVGTLCIANMSGSGRMQLVMLPLDSR